MVDAGSTCSTGMPSTSGKMQQWQPRIPLSIASAVRSWNSESTSERRPPQYGQRSTSSVSMRIGDFAEVLEHRIAGGRLQRRAPELFDAEPAPRLVFVDPGHRIVRSHLGAVAAQR